MIVRIVKLTIQTEKAEQFKIFFTLKIIGEMKKYWKNIEILKFLNQFGNKQNYILVKNHKHGV